MLIRLFIQRIFNQAAWLIYFSRRNFLGSRRNGYHYFHYRFSISHHLGAKDEKKLAHVLVNRSIRRNGCADYCGGLPLANDSLLCGFGHPYDLYHF